MWWKIIVYALLTAPEPIDLSGADYPPEALAALKSVSYELEIADPRECWSENFAGELLACRWRYQELEGAPRLAEGDWLPPATLCRDNAAFAGSIAKALRSLMGFSAWEDEWLNVAAAELERLALVWWHAEMAADPHIHTHQRRAYLQSVCASLGASQWWGRTMPPHVPLALLPQR